MCSHTSICWSVKDICYSIYSPINVLRKLYIICFRTATCHSLDNIFYRYRRWGFRDIWMFLLPMNRQSWTLREASPANRADVRTNPRMRQEMHLPASRACERLFAYVAQVRLLSGVRFNVFLQGCLTRQFHTAFLAHVSLLVLPHVTIQALLSLQPLLAHRTLKVRVLHLVFIVFVEIKGHSVRRCCTAHVADTRISLVCNQVLGIISLYPEFSIALVAREAKIISMFAREVYLQSTLAYYHSSELNLMSYMLYSLWVLSR